MTRVSSMGVDIEYLIQFLEDELKGLDDIRVSPTFPSSTVKSPDLPQDYDPNSGTLHLLRGVTVRARSRDYFFPADWAKHGKMHLIHEQAKEIREFCERE